MKPTCTKDKKVGYDGSCEKCPDFKLQDPDNDINCKQPTCEDLEVVTVDGKCQKCPEYEIVSTSLTECEMK